MGTSVGVSPATFRKAWESVTTRAGGFFMLSRQSRSSRSLTTTQVASWSSRSRIVCTCGMIKRPLGASRSMGTTSTTVSPPRTMSPTIVGGVISASGTTRISSWRNSGAPRPSEATARMWAMSRAARSASSSGAGWARSSLLKTTTTGVSSAVNSATSPSSKSPHAPASQTMAATSARSIILRDFSTRSAPRAPTSSMPAVSMKSTGPSGSSSMAFSTGSVVVPATGETIETCWRVTTLRKEDLPALRRPKMPI